jgi:hypothetical protein
MQTIIVAIIILISLSYLIGKLLKSLKTKSKGSCSSCGKE